MSLESENRKAMVDLYIEKADQCWGDAVKACQLEAWSMAANRLYYTLVNGFRALLIQDQHPSHKHNGIKSLVGQYYVVTGELTDAEGKLYSQLETMREKADYDCFFKATKQDIELKFEPTCALLNRIKELLSTRMTDAQQNIDTSETTPDADDDQLDA